MKSTVKQLKKHRRYSEEFKRELVSLFEQGKFSVLQLEKLYGVTDASIYTWIYKYSNFNEKSYRIIEMKSSNTDKLKQMEERIRDLERVVGQKQIMIDYLETMIDVAKDELSYDIKKNFATPQSKGSEKKPKK